MAVQKDNSENSHFFCQADNFRVVSFDDSLLIFNKKSGETHRLSGVSAYLFDSLFKLQPQTLKALKKELYTDLPDQDEPQLNTLVVETLNQLEGLYLIERH